MKLEQMKKLIGLYCTRKTTVIAVVLMGIITACLEGVGAGLIIPLFKSLSNSSEGETGNRFLNFISAPFENIDASHRLIIVLIIFLSVVIIKNVIIWSYEVLTRWFVYRVRNDITRKAYSQMLNVGYRFIQASKQGEIFRLLNDNVASAAEVLGCFLSLLSYVFIMIIFVVILSAISWKMTLLSLMLCTLLALSMNKLSNVLSRIAVTLNDTSIDIVSYWFEAIQSMRIIRIFNREKYEESRRNGVWMQFYNVALKNARMQALVSPLSEVFTTSLVVIILISSSIIMKVKVANILPSLVAFLYVMNRIQANVGKINQKRMQLATNMVGLYRVFEGLETCDKPYILSGKRQLKEINCGIKLMDVRYKYPNADKIVLKDISFEIPKGKITAIVGVSGSGKSTILDLILRLADPSSGQIAVDGYPLSEYQLTEWRNLIGMVDQEAFIFNATVADNIRYGLLEASDEQIVAAANSANAHDFICDLQDGYQTLLGDRGTRLSGGQRQRIAIARAVLRDAPIMIFDEATSSLDSESEQLIHNAIHSISVDRTVILVAHRLSTVVNADNIIILQDGRICEMGNHTDLMSMEGRYSQLFTAQRDGLVLNNIESNTAKL